MSCGQELEGVKAGLADGSLSRKVCNGDYKWDTIGPEIDESKLCALGNKEDNIFVDSCPVSFY